MATSAIEPIERQDLGSLDDLVGYHLRRASALFAADFAHAIADTGMRQVLFGILSIINANPGINQGNVGRALGVQRANMVSLVTELVDRDLVSRDVATDDRRAFALSLTAAGERMVKTCLDLIRVHEERLLADFSPSDRVTLIALLGRIEAKERP